MRGLVDLGSHTADLIRERVSLCVLRSDPKHSVERYDLKLAHRRTPALLKWLSAAALRAQKGLGFTVGAVLRLLAILLPPPAWRVPMCVGVVLVALGLAGWVGARLGGSRSAVAVARGVIGGGMGLAITYAIGLLFGAAVG